MISLGLIFIFGAFTTLEATNWDANQINPEPINTMARDIPLGSRGGNNEQCCNQQCPCGKWYEKCSECNTCVNRMNWPELHSCKKDPCVSPCLQIGNFQGSHGQVCVNNGGGSGGAYICPPWTPGGQKGQWGTGYPGSQVNPGGSGGAGGSVYPGYPGGMYLCSEKRIVRFDLRHDFNLKL